MPPRVKIIRSPNHSSRHSADVRMIVMHYTADSGGICGRCHIASTKDDPGPHLPWKRVLGIESA